MRVVIATPLYPPEIGGPATYAKLLADRLPSKGVEVEMVKFSDSRGPKLIRHYRYYRALIRVVGNADVVLALDPVSVGLPALWAAQKYRKPLILKVGGDYAWEQGTQRFGIADTLEAFVTRKKVPLTVALLRKVQLKVARRAHKVIAPSEYLKKIIIAWGVPADKISVIYNSVQLEPLGTVPAAVAALPRPLVVTAGRLVPWKHIDAVIDAVATIPYLSLAIVGDGPESRALRARVTEKLSSRVVFTGVLAHADLLATIKSANWFVLNSSYEGLSHLLVEARMLGANIVATCAGGNAEVISDERDGRLIPVGDTEALMKVLREGKVLLPAHTAKFSEETMLADTIDLLCSV
jgi:glycosyltransferase involved in cell wall biosynthesis